MAIRYIVSACLAGLNCRSDGGNSRSEEVVEWVRQGIALPICPEQLGGLSTPRPCSEIVGGDGQDVLAGRARVRYCETGEDVTAEFIRGAQESLRLAQLVGAAEAVLKQKSPSCGCGQIYCQGRLSEGDGVAAALLKKNGILVRPAELTGKG